jgi:hypothetical protein
MQMMQDETSAVPVKGVHDTSLMLEIKQGSQGNPQENPPQVLSAYYVDAGNLPVDSNMQDAFWGAPDMSSVLVNEASKIASNMWTRQESNEWVHVVTRETGTECLCEVKLSKHAENGLLAVVRDVTERVRLFDAEKRADAEALAQQHALARQQDAQEVNRFTRHEVKNGLLTGKKKVVC